MRRGLLDPFGERPDQVAPPIAAADGRHIPHPRLADLVATTRLRRTIDNPRGQVE